MDSAIWICAMIAGLVGLTAGLLLAAVFAKGACREHHIDELA